MMNLKTKFLNLLDRMGRRRIVYDRVDDQPYLERYYLFLKDRGDKFPVEGPHPIQLHIAYRGYAIHA